MTKMTKEQSKGCTIILFIIIVFLVLLFFLCKSLCHTSPKSQSEPKKVTIQIDQTRHIKRNSAFGCTDKDMYFKLHSYISQKDDKAFNQAYTMCLLTGECKTFTKTDKLMIMDQDVWKEICKVRLPGETKEYWIGEQFIE